jgi:hypothetical protein
MNKILVASVAIAALVIAPVGPNQAFGASTGPGKKSAFESSDFNGFGDIPAGVSPLLTATIVKGKKKNVLVVEATLSTGSSPSSSYLYLRTDVNGWEIEPLDGGGSSQVLTDCNGTPCTLTAAWWLDLDAAEAAHPGVFIGQPLTVTLRGGEGSPSPQYDGKVTMSVRLEKK